MVEQLTAEVETQSPIEACVAAYEMLLAGAEQLNATESVTDRVAVLNSMVSGVNEAFTADVKEGSSFRDITVNLLSSILSEARFLKDYDPNAEYGDPDEEEEYREYAAYAGQNLPVKVELLRDYVEVLASDPAMFADEISKTEGAYPDLRQQAPKDRAALLEAATTDTARAAVPSTVAIYIESMVTAHEAENIG